MKRTLIICLIVILLCSFGAVSADMGITETDYRKQMTQPDIPEVLNVGTYLDCGDLQIKLMGQPVVSVSTTGLKASGDKSFLVIRAAIKNNSDKPVKWLDPQSFHAQEYYLNIIGRSYDLSSYMSAKAAASFSLPAFFSIIQPGAELSTVIAFEVYGNVDGWVITFSPFTREAAGPDTSVSFTLPKVTRQ